MTKIVPANAPGELSRELRELLEEARGYFDASLAKNTRKAYASDWSMFTRWCTRVGAQSLPADPAVVGAYITALAQGTAFPEEVPPKPRKASTINRHLASISVHHQDAKLPSPLLDKTLQRVIQGIRNKLGTRPTKKKPLTGDLIRDVLPILPLLHDAENAADLIVRDRAMLLLDFYGAFRRSEVVSLNVDDVEFRREGLHITLVRSKTDQEGKGRTIIVNRNEDPELCPVVALQAWFEVLARLGVKDGAIFRSLSRRNPAERLDGRSVLRLVKAAVAYLPGLKAKDFGGHSLRSGHVTTAARAGTRLDVIQAQTGHRLLDTLVGYIDREGSFENNSSKDLFNPPPKKP